MQIQERHIQISKGNGRPIGLFAPFRYWNLWGVLCVALTLCACSWLEHNDPALMDQPYYQKIRQWQRQIEADGWSAEVVDEILRKSRALTQYEMELDDEWKTPKALMRARLKGDCEDIAIFMLAALKQLKYPYKARVLIVEDLFADHALLKVELPDGGWLCYDSTSKRTFKAMPKRAMPIVEFDDQVILYHASGHRDKIVAIP